MKLDQIEKAEQLLKDRTELKENIEYLIKAKDNKEYKIQITVSRTPNFFGGTGVMLIIPTSSETISLVIAEMQTRLAKLEAKIMEL